MKEKEEGEVFFEKTLRNKQTIMMGEEEEEEKSVFEQRRADHRAIIKLEMKKAKKEEFFSKYCSISEPSCMASFSASRTR